MWVCGVVSKCQINISLIKFINIKLYDSNSFIKVFLKCYNSARIKRFKDISNKWM